MRKLLQTFPGTEMETGRPRVDHAGAGVTRWGASFSLDRLLCRIDASWDFRKSFAMIATPWYIDFASSERTWVAGHASDGQEPS